MAPPNPPQRRNSDFDIPDEAPPPYAPVSADQTLDAGPMRPDFSGPPPLPDRLQPSATGGLPLSGVGMGYGPRPNGAVGGQSSSQYAPPSHPPPLPNRPPTQPTASPTPPSAASSGSRPDGSNSQLQAPTEVPTPGRVLLHHGNMLIYPRGHQCPKCSNTGFKNGDPSNPCNSDWRKYGRPYSGALAASFLAAGRNEMVAGDNFQRPLPNHRPAGQGYGSSYGAGTSYTSSQPQRPPPPPPPPMGAYPGHAPQPYPQSYQPYYNYSGHPRPVQSVYTYGMPPAGAVVLRPGDPRIGGSLCLRCNGTGQEMFFLFDDGPCRDCRGTGRVF